VNVAGLFLIIPLLTAVWPLVRVWWDTRSDESFRRSQATAAERAARRSATADGTRNQAASQAAKEGGSLAAMTNRLAGLGDLSDQALSTIIQQQFGGRQRSATNSGVFDADSAVFDSITRHELVIQGKEYVCYEIDLVDLNANHRVQVDCYEEPNLDYERSIAALELVKSNPQLKKIYEAFAKNLPATESKPGAQSDEAGPALRFELSPAPGP
jgi:hypothetical protein